jgi:hypothetical protein
MFDAAALVLEEIAPEDKAVTFLSPKLKNFPVNDRKPVILSVLVQKADAKSVGNPPPRALCQIHRTARADPTPLLAAESTPPCLEKPRY